MEPAVSVLVVPAEPTELPAVPDASTLDEVPIVLEAFAPLVVPTELLPALEPERLVPAEPEAFGG